jgi:probable addiction module antidote protein
MTRTAKNHRDQPRMIAKLLNDTLAKDDTIAFVKAIGDLIRAQGVTEVSQKSGLTRSALYVSFGGTLMPNIDKVIRTLAVLQLEIVVRPIGPS